MSNDGNTSSKSQRRHTTAPSLQHRGPRMLMALSLSAATLLVTCSSAQATWTHVAPTKDHHCSGTFRAPHTQPVSMQTCVIVHDSPSGAYVQGSVKVANQDENTQRRVRPTGYTRV